jgi:queuine/archaeosine tRNA-ribosyltransferase
MPRMPCFFASVSSVKTNLAPGQYLRVLRTVGTDAFLISAYDIAHATPKECREISAALAKADKVGQSLLIDSGNYESYWKSDHRWSRSRFHAAIKKAVPHGSLVLSYDNQEPPKRVAKIVDDVVRGFESDQAALRNWRVQPIVHAPTELLPRICAEIAAKLSPELLVVPERLLGDGIVARARMVAAIRRTLNERLGRRQLLHLLGTGNPRSLLAFVACGADSFDGLEWCQTVVDHQQATLHHLQHYDFFAWQTNFVGLAGASFVAKALAHNLSFYADWMARLRQASQTNTFGGMAREVLPAGIAKDLAAALPEAFAT